MLDTLTFNFGHIPPKKNNRKFVKTKRGGFTVPSDAYDAWHQDMRDRYSFKVRLLRSPVPVHSRFWLGSFTRSDMSNQQESIHDWLTDMGVIEDDATTDLHVYSCQFVGLSQGSPRVETTVTALDLTPADQAIKILREDGALRTYVGALKAAGHKTSQVKERLRLYAELTDFEAFNERYADTPLLIAPSS